MTKTVEIKLNKKEYQLVPLKVKDFGVSEKVAINIGKKFAVIIDDMANLEEDLLAVVSAPLKPATFKKAKALRNKYVKIRTHTSRIHKEEKNEFVKVGKYIDAWKNAQLNASRIIETNLLKIEKYEEELKQIAINELHDSRKVLLSEFVEESATIPPLGEMDDVVWKAFLEGMKSAYNKRLEDKKIAAALAEREKLLRPLWYLMTDEEKVSYREMVTVDFDLLINKLKEKELLNKQKTEKLANENKQLKKQISQPAVSFVESKSENIEPEVKSEEKDVEAELDNMEKLRYHISEIILLNFDDPKMKWFEETRLYLEQIYNHIKK